MPVTTQTNTQFQNGTTSKKSMCIIGAGAAGLVTLKNIIASNSKQNGQKLEPIVFEKSDSIGGVWNWSENDPSKNIDNAMYANLKTNLPKEVMRFMDFSSENYGYTQESYVSQKDVLNYLKNYADFYKLSDFIQLSHKVTSVRPITEKEGNETDPRWLVIVQNLKSPSEYLEFEFDSVVICNGHHNRRKYPKGYEHIKTTFRGELLHSLDYKGPEKFHHRNVVVIGGGPSGIDVAIAVSNFANQVYLCTKDMNKRFQNTESLKNFRQTTIVQTVLKNSVVLEDGEEIQCDAIIFCTGYEYDFPFLAPEILDIQDGGKNVTPLYQHVVHRKFRSLGFIGIPWIALAFLMCDCQSRYYIAYLRGDFTLPTISEMEQHYLDDQRARKPYGLDGPKSHLLYNIQWPYFKELAKKAGFSKELEPFVPIFSKIYQLCCESHNENPVFYRTIDYESILKSPKFLKLCDDEKISL